MQVSAPIQSALMPVRNAKSGPTVFRDSPNDVTIRWEGAGDPSGADWQHVPSQYVQHPAFADMIRKGVLVVGTEQQANDAFASQLGHIAGADLAAQAEGAFYRPEVNDFLQVACIGPGGRPGSACSTATPQRQSDQGKTPPLCDAHKHLAGEYVPVEGTDPTTGLSAPTWARVATTDRLTEAQQGIGPVPTA